MDNGNKDYKMCFQSSNILELWIKKIKLFKILRFHLKNNVTELNVYIIFFEMFVLGRFLSSADATRSCRRGNISALMPSILSSTACCHTNAMI